MSNSENWFKEILGGVPQEPTEEQIVEVICGQCEPDEQLRILAMIRKNEELQREFLEILNEIDDDYVQLGFAGAYSVLRTKAIQQRKLRLQSGS